MFRRRPILRTAMVGGVAYAAGSHGARKSAEQDQLEAQQNAQIADLQQQQTMQQQPPPAPPQYQQPLPAPPQYQQPAASPPAPSSGVAPETLEQLKQLGELHTSGILTDDEFETAKQKILGQL